MPRPIVCTPNDSRKKPTCAAIIIDNSSSMHYPKLKENQQFFENKIGFSVLASAVLMNLLKKQRDAIDCVFRYL
jgi:hypothetical protein